MQHQAQFLLDWSAIVDRRLGGTFTGEGRQIELIKHILEREMVQWSVDHHPQGTVRIVLTDERDRSVEVRIA